jgi:TRAF3-interacting protein 1
MGDLDSLVAEAKTKISELISKPKMAEKLLSKPPFRFLHDTITAITNATGFGEGLYSPEELDSAGITDKNAKTAYLDKIFALVGICKVTQICEIDSQFYVYYYCENYLFFQGYNLEVRSLKVVQGLEAEFTNKFLIALAECASDASIDNAAAVQRALANEEPGTSPPPRKSVGT